MKNTPKIPQFIRLISAVLVLCLSVEQLGWAAPEAARLSFGARQKAHFELPVPMSVARVEDAWFAPDQAAPTIYLIQDAHTNPSAQLNLAKTLEALFQADPELKTVFVEAGFGNDTLWPIRKYVPDNERARLAKIELRKGLLHGEEYLNLTGKTPFTIWGVEDRPLYEKAIAAYRTTQKNRPILQAVLDRIQNTQSYLQGRLLNPLLLAFDRQRAAYEKGELPLTGYLEVLKKFNARHAEYDTRNFSELEKLWKLKKLEESIDFKTAQREQTAILAAMTEADRGELERVAHRPGKLKARDSKDGEEGYWAVLEEKIVDGRQSIVHGPSTMDYGQTSALLKYLEYRKRARGLNLENVLSEIKSFEETVLKKLTLHEDEESFLAAEKLLSLQRNLFSFTLTNEEFETYKKLSRTLTPRRHLGFLNRKLMEEGSAPEKALFLEESYEKLIAEAESFYQITRDRDEAFLKNMFDSFNRSESPAGPDRAGPAFSGRLDVQLRAQASRLRHPHDQAADGQDPPDPTSLRVSAVLITGGYHTKNLKELLRARGVSYVSITPQVAEETNLKRYEEILLGGDSAASGRDRVLQASPSLKVATAGRMARTLGRADVPGGFLPLMPGADFATAEGARLAVKNETLISASSPESLQEAIEAGQSSGTGARLASDRAKALPVLAVVAAFLGWLFWPTDKSVQMMIDGQESNIEYADDGTRWGVVTARLKDPKSLRHNPMIYIQISSYLVPNTPIQYGIGLRGSDGVIRVQGDSNLMHGTSNGIQIPVSETPDSTLTLTREDFDKPVVEVFIKLPEALSGIRIVKVWFGGPPGAGLADEAEHARLFFQKLKRVNLFGIVDSTAQLLTIASAGYALGLDPVFNVSTILLWAGLEFSKSLLRVAEPLDQFLPSHSLNLLIMASRAVSMRFASIIEPTGTLYFGLMAVSLFVPPLIWNSIVFIFSNWSAFGKVFIDRILRERDVPGPKTPRRTSGSPSETWRPARTDSGNAELSPDEEWMKGVRERKKGEGDGARLAALSIKLAESNGDVVGSSQKVRDGQRLLELLVQETGRTLTVRKKLNSIGGFSFAGMPYWFASKPHANFTAEVILGLGKHQMPVIVSVKLLYDAQGNELSPNQSFIDGSSIEKDREGNISAFHVNLPGDDLPYSLQDGHTLTVRKKLNSNGWFSFAGIPYWFISKPHAHFTAEVVLGLDEHRKPVVQSVTFTLNAHADKIEDHVLYRVSNKTLMLTQETPAARLADVQVNGEKVTVQFMGETFSAENARDLEQKLHDRGVGAVITAGDKVIRYNERVNAAPYNSPDILKDLLVRAEGERRSYRLDRDVARELTAKARQMAGQSTEWRETVWREAKIAYPDGRPDSFGERARNGEVTLNDKVLIAYMYLYFVTAGANWTTFPGRTVGEKLGRIKERLRENALYRLTSPFRSMASVITDVGVSWVTLEKQNEFRAMIQRYRSGTLPREPLIRFMMQSGRGPRLFAEMDLDKIDWANSRVLGSVALVAPNVQRPFRLNQNDGLAYLRSWMAPDRVYRLEKVGPNWFMEAGKEQLHVEDTQKIRLHDGKLQGNSTGRSGPWAPFSLGGIPAEDLERYPANDIHLLVSQDGTVRLIQNVFSRGDNPAEVTWITRQFRQAVFESGQIRYLAGADSDAADKPVSRSAPLERDQVAVSHENGVTTITIGQNVVQALDAAVLAFRLNYLVGQAQWDSKGSPKLRSLDFDGNMRTPLGHDPTPPEERRLGVFLNGNFISDFGWNKPAEIEDFFARRGFEVVAARLAALSDIQTAVDHLLKGKNYGISLSVASKGTQFGKGNNWFYQRIEQDGRIVHKYRLRSALLNSHVHHALLASIAHRTSLALPVLTDQVETEARLSLSGSSRPEGARLAGPENSMSRRSWGKLIVRGLMLLSPFVVASYFRNVIAYRLYEMTFSNGTFMPMSESIGGRQGFVNYGTPLELSKGDRLHIRIDGYSPSDFNPNLVVVLTVENGPNRVRYLRIDPIEIDMDTLHIQSDRDLRIRRITTVVYPKTAKGLSADLRMHITPEHVRAAAARLTGEFLTPEERTRLTPRFAGVSEFLDKEEDWRRENREAVELGLVRHPESTSNLFHYTQSYVNFSPPTWRGYRQRDAFAKFLDRKKKVFDRYISSGLERADAGIHRAARNAGKKIEVLKRFREANILWHPGLLRRQVRAINEEFFERFQDDPFNFAVPGWSGKRVKFFLTEFLNDAASGKMDRNILVGLHGLTLVLTVMVALDLPSTRYREVYKLLGDTPNLGLLFLSYNPSHKKWELLTRVDDSYLPQNLRGKTTFGLAILAERAYFLSRYFYRLYVDRWLLDKQSDEPDYFPIGTPVVPLSDAQLDVIVKDHEREARPDQGARLTEEGKRLEERGKRKNDYAPTLASSLEILFSWLGIATRTASLSSRTSVSSVLKRPFTSVMSFLRELVSSAMNLMSFLRLSKRTATWFGVNSLDISGNLANFAQPVNFSAARLADLNGIKPGDIVRITLKYEKVITSETVSEVILPNDSLGRRPGLLYGHGEWSNLEDIVAVKKAGPYQYGALRKRSIFQDANLETTATYLRSLAMDADEAEPSVSFGGFDPEWWWESSHPLFSLGGITSEQLERILKLANEKGDGKDTSFSISLGSDAKTDKTKHVYVDRASAVRIGAFKNFNLKQVVRAIRRKEAISTRFAARWLTSQARPTGFWEKLDDRFEQTYFLRTANSKSYYELVFLKDNRGSVYHVIVKWHNKPLSIKSPNLLQKEPEQVFYPGDPGFEEFIKAVQSTPRTLPTLKAIAADTSPVQGKEIVDNFHLLDNFIRSAITRDNKAPANSFYREIKRWVGKTPFVAKIAYGIIQWNGKIDPTTAFLAIHGPDDSRGPLRLYRIKNLGSPAATMERVPIEIPQRLRDKNSFLFFSFPKSANPLLLFVEGYLPGPGNAAQSVIYSIHSYQERPDVYYFDSLMKMSRQNGLNNVELSVRAAPYDALLVHDGTEYPFRKRVASTEGARLSTVVPARETIDGKATSDGEVRRTTATDQGEINRLLKRALDQNLSAYVRAIVRVKMDTVRLVQGKLTQGEWKYGEVKIGEETVFKGNIERLSVQWNSAARLADGLTRREKSEEIAPDSVGIDPRAVRKQTHVDEAKQARRKPDVDYVGAEQEDNGARLSASAVRSFILGVALSVGSFFLSEARALPIGHEVYSLKQNADILFVIQENGAAQEIALKANAIREVRAPKISNLKREEALEKDLKRAQEAESLSPGVADLETPYLLVYDTDALVGDDREISNFVKQIGAKAGRNAHILLLGSHAQKALDEVRYLGVKGSFILSIGLDQKDLPTAVMTNTQNLPRMREQFTGARFATVAPAIVDGQAGYFPAGSLTQYLKLLVQAKLDHAYEFFKRMTQKNPTLTQYESVANGDSILSEQFAIEPIFRDVAQYLRKIWTAARTFATAA